MTEGMGFKGPALSQGLQVGFREDGHCCGVGHAECLFLTPAGLVARHRDAEDRAKLPKRPHKADPQGHVEHNGPTW